ncbi:MarR family transcriptional regulator [Umezawaea endophytica]|uniref:MarR family transcriptional regulator n=1 Tax=Umezawaea endophytica TaxID=1654476 RepID=A0A9X2VQP1_9PSEU|nr:MarR family transcriptional regulator [Umezawaea endophytica]MCS7481098.1 MarR family transcriptional regulator [Umezawaea endophytica]
MDKSAAVGRELSTAVVMFHEAVGQKLGVSAGDQRALTLLRGGPLTAGALAKEIGLTPGAVTGMVDRLEGAGLVRREPDPNDRRRVLVTPTTPGHNAHSNVFTDLSAAMAAMMTRYSPAEQKIISDFVDRTVDVLKEQTAKLTVKK